MCDHAGTLHIHSLESEQLGDGLVGAEQSSSMLHLSARAVFLAESGDTMVVGSYPDRSWLSFLESVGLVLPEIIVTHGNGDSLSKRILNDSELLSSLSDKRWKIAPYMGSEHASEIGRVLDSVLVSPSTDLVNRLNQKSNLDSILTGLGLPSIPTVVSKRDNIVETVLARLEGSGGLMVRADISIGGRSVWKVEKASDIEALKMGAMLSPESRRFIIQPLLDVAVSPNAQYELTSLGVRSLGITQQVISDEQSFNGSAFPISHTRIREINKQSEILVSRLYADGYRGNLGIDYVITNRGEVYIVEINPRVNTSTFSLKLCAKLGRSAFRLMTGIPAGNMAGHDSVVACLDQELLYSPAQRAGMIPLVVPSMDYPWLDAMVFGDDVQVVQETADRVESLVRRRCSAECLR